MKIQLNEAHIWQKLSSPYGNSDEIPDLISKLIKTNSKEFSDQIIWECIYHQGTIYENTLATIPYLVKIANNTDSSDLRIDLILSLGTVLLEFDESVSFESIFKNNSLDEDSIQRIKIAFIKSMKDFTELVNNSFDYVDKLDEFSKIFFLSSYLTTIKRYKEARVFNRYSENEEYILVCSNCKSETYLLNEENSLKGYHSDPILNENKIIIPVDLSNSYQKLEWLEKCVNQFNINLLKPLLPYFKGCIICHNCHNRVDVFEGIINSV